MKICSYCEEEIEDGQLYEVDSDGDSIHLCCAAQIDDGNDLNNLFGCS